MRPRQNFTGRATLCGAGLGQFLLALDILPFIWRISWAKFFGFLFSSGIAPGRHCLPLFGLPRGTADGMIIVRDERSIATSR